MSWPSRAARVALPLLIALAAGVAALQLAHVERQRAHARLRVRSGEAVQVLRSRVDDYADVLYGIRGLFGASGHVTQDEFHEHVGAVDVSARYPAVRAVGLAQHESPDRFVVDYSEPTGAGSAMGRDLFTWPGGRRAARRALRTDRPALTAPVDGSGFVVLLAIRTRSFDGIAYATIDTAALMHGLLTGREPADLALYDLGPVGSAARPSRERRTYASGSGAPHGRRTVTFAELGRRWALRYAPREPLMGTMERAAPWEVLGAGLLLAWLAAWLLSAAARTERRAVALAERMTADLRRKESELERSNAELERFAQVASHDLREPLRSVSGFVRLLERRHGDALDEEARGWIAAALDGTRRMSALIGDLLAYARAGDGEDADAPSGDLALAWELATRNLAAAIRESRAIVRAGRLPCVAATQAEVNQVVQNLLANAIKYRGADRPLVHADALREGDDWVLTVSDNGIGIDPCHHDDVFVLFERLHDDDEYEGTGMGLSLCKKIVEARGGSISLESELGRGARFTVVLPAAGRALVAA